MFEKENYCLVVTTCESDAEAEALAGKLVEQGLAACVQLSEIRSVYRWEGRVCTDPEVQLQIKTRMGVYAELEAFIREHHSYEVPEIVRIPIEGGLVDYLRWIDDVTGKG